MWQPETSDRQRAKGDHYCINNLNKSEIEQMVNDARQHEADDRKRRDLLMPATQQKHWSTRQRSLA